MTLRAADDERDHALSQALVRLADDGGLVDAGVAHEPLLDLERMHVLAARDDHVVDAPDEVEVAVGVELPEVAGEVPAVPDLALVGVGPLPVAGERLVAGERAGHLADLPRRHLGLRRGARHGLDEADARVQRGAPGAARLGALIAVDRERVDLGRAVVVDERLGREDLDAALHEHAGHGRAGIGERAHAREVARSLALRGDHVVEERRREIQRRQPLTLHGVQRRRRRETRAGCRRRRRRRSRPAASACPSCGRAA